MKRYITRIAMLIGSMIMSLAGNTIALIAALLGSDRAWPVAVANDQALNAALIGRSGSEDETVSSRAGKAAQSGRIWGCVLCRFLDFFDKKHCEKSIENDEGRNT